MAELSEATGRIVLDHITSATARRMHVERIGDCATNLAEDVIYLVEGEIARHHFDHLNPAAQ